MKRTLLEIGCDGGSITICSNCLNGIFIYKLKSFEIFTDSNSNTATFTTIYDSWVYLKHRYPKWHQLYLVQISTQMTEFVKKDYIMKPDKNKYTMDGWLLHLTGRGIGF